MPLSWPRGKNRKLHNDGPTKEAIKHVSVFVCLIPLKDTLLQSQMRAALFLSSSVYFFPVGTIMLHEKKFRMPCVRDTLYMVHALRHKEK